MSSLRRSVYRSCRLGILLFMLCFPTGCAGFTTSNGQTQTATAENLDKTNAQTNASVLNPESTQSSDATNPLDSSTNIPTVGSVSSEKTNEQKSLDTLNASRQLLASGSYRQAIEMAVSSYVAAPSDEAKTIMFYAASQLTPIEVMRLETKVQTHIEQATLGQIRLNQCAAQNDADCIAQLLPKTADSLQMIGDEEAAQRLINSPFIADGASLPTAAVLLPLSGADRKLGRAMLGAMLQAAGIYNHQPIPFALRFFDTKTSPDAIPPCLDEADALHAKLIIGPLDIRESMAATKKLSSDTVLIGFSPNDEFIANRPNAFQFSYALTEESQQIAKLIVSLNPSKIAAVSPEDAYSAESIRQLQASLPATHSISTLSFPANQTDLRDIAKKVAKESPDIVFLPTSPDIAERIASFMAQENLWCKSPGTPQPKAVADQRKFITCLSTSAWAPIASDHRYKFIVNAIYLDYIEAASQIAPDFAFQFEKLYHRLPAVQEIMPFILLSMLKNMPEKAWQSAESLQKAVYDALNGQRYLLIPGLRQVTEQSSTPYLPPASADALPGRTINSR